MTQQDGFHMHMHARQRAYTILKDPHFPSTMRNTGTMLWLLPLRRRQALAARAASCLVVILMMLLASPAGATTRPMWGILTQPNGLSDDDRAFTSIPASYAFINSDYVKWIEMAGARAVPVPYDAPLEVLEELLGKINGLIFPGGNDIIDHTAYYRAARFLFDRALEMNRNGDYFPVHGTCLGLELLAELVAGGDFGVLTHVDAENISLPLRFHVGDPTKESRIYSRLSPEQAEALASRNLTENFHHYGVTLATWEATPALPAFFALVSDSRDRAGVPFVSTMEARDFPIYATQWHPERSLYEWNPNEDIKHGETIVEVVQLVADFLVAESRRSGHKFASPAEEAAASVYNYPCIYNGKSGHGTPQIYVFEPYGQGRERSSSSSSVPALFQRPQRLRGAGENVGLTAAQ